VSTGACRDVAAYALLPSHAVNYSINNTNVNVTLERNKSVLAIKIDDDGVFGAAGFDS
jgi:hypothetical protein